MTIDIHAHAVPEGFIAAAASEVPQVAPKVVERRVVFWSEESRARKR